MDNTNSRDASGLAFAGPRNRQQRRAAASKRGHFDRRIIGEAELDSLSRADSIQQFQRLMSPDFGGFTRGEDEGGKTHVRNVRLHATKGFRSFRKPARGY